MFSYLNLCWHILYPSKLQPDIHQLLGMVCIDCIMILHVIFFWTFCPLAGSLDSGVAAQGAVAGMLPETSRPWYSSTSLASSDLASPGAVRLPSANPSTATPSQGNGGEFYPKQHLFGFFAPCIYLHPCWINTRSHLWVCALEDWQDHEEWRHTFFTSEIKFTSVGHDSPC